MEERMNHMPIMVIFLLFFPVNYIKEIVLVETNKYLHHPVLFGELLHFIGCWFVMSFYERIFNHRDWWSPKSVSMHEGSPFSLHKWMPHTSFEYMLRSLYYTDQHLPSFHDPYLHRGQMEES